MRLPSWFSLGLMLVFAGPSLAGAPAKAAVKPLDAAALAERIDHLVEKHWQEKKIKPAPVAEDTEFLRRLHLDLVGCIPAVADVRKFLDAKENQTRQGEINRLLSEPRYVTHLSASWRSILLPPNNNLQFQPYSAPFEVWLDKQIKEDVPYDKLVRDLITVPNNQVAVRGGNPNQVSPGGFFQAYEVKPENLAASSSRIFLGVKLECSQCHDHPFADYTQAQFWQFAAFFSALQGPAQRNDGARGQSPAKAPGREIRIPGKDKLVQAKFLDGKNPEWRDGVDSRVILAEWMTAPENPYFARTAVNRVWAHFFGLGIIDPVDDEPTGENPASHPELLAELSQQFIANKYDVKYLIRAMTLSKTYQRTSAVSHDSQNDARAFARMAIKGLTPEQLFDSLAQAMGYYNPAKRVNTREGFIFLPGTPHAEFFNRFTAQDKRTETHTSILHALALMNGKFVADATKLEKGGIRKDFSKGHTLTRVVETPGWTVGQRIEALYLAAVSRPPRQNELTRLTAYVNGAPDQAQALGDIFWALLNSPEFMFNH